MKNTGNRIPGWEGVRDPKTERPCRVCGRIFPRSELSSRYRCEDCGRGRAVESILSLMWKQGEYWEKWLEGWRRGMKRSRQHLKYMTPEEIDEVVDRVKERAHEARDEARA